jgi:hypothetical protein
MKRWNGGGDEHLEQEEDAYLALARTSYSLPDRSTIPDWQAILRGAKK